MRISKYTIAFALAGLFLTFAGVAHAEGVLRALRIDSSDLASYVPLVLLVLAAIVVYLCNRPRVTVCARARRRTDSSRNAPH